MGVKKVKVEWDQYPRSILFMKSQAEWLEARRSETGRAVGDLIREAVAEKMEREHQPGGRKCKAKKI